MPIFEVAVTSNFSGEIYVYRLNQIFYNKPCSATIPILVGPEWPGDDRRSICALDCQAPRSFFGIYGPFQPFSGLGMLYVELFRKRAADRALYLVLRSAARENRHVVWLTLILNFSSSMLAWGCLPPPVFANRRRYSALPRGKMLRWRWV